MKKRVILFLLFALPILLFGGWRYKGNFLTTAVNCGTSASVVNGSDFTSAEISIPRDVQLVLMTVTFTRTTGSSSKVYFEFQSSNDNGTTWTTEYIQRIEIATNATAVSNIVRYAEWVPAAGVSNFRLSQITNNDSSHALTACNVTISF